MKRDIQLPTPSVRELVTQVPVAKGGTGGKTSSEAAANLGAIHQNQLGKAGGVAQLDGSGKLLTSTFPDSAVTGPTLSGSNRVSVNDTLALKITNYDPDTAYPVSTTVGYVAVSGDTVYFWAPATTGTATITVGGRQFLITIAAAIPVTPVISASTLGSSGLATVIASTTAFSEPNSGVHKSTDWQVSRNIDFSDLAASSLDDTVNKTTWTSPQVALSSKFYVRSRHRDTNNVVSDWSNIAEVATGDSYVPATETAILSAFDKESGGFFGRSCAISGDGARIAVGAAGATVGGVSGAGKTYVFVKIGSVWTLEQMIPMPNPTTGDNFGNQVCFDQTGTRLVINAPGNDVSGTVDAGTIYVYVRSTSTWTLEQRLTPPGTLVAGTFYGSGIDITPDGTRMAVGSQGGASVAGSVNIYLRTGSTWALEATLTASDSAVNSFFGLRVSLDATATRVVVGSYFQANGGNGAVYIFTRTGTSWVQEQKLTGTVAGGNYGFTVEFSQDGNRIVIGNRGIPVGSQTTAGTVEIWIRSGTTWALEATLSAPDAATGDYFGYYIKLNYDATLLLASSFYGDKGTVSNTGAVYLFSRTGTTWSYIRKYNGSNSATGDAFGLNLDMSYDGSTIVIAAYAQPAGGVTNAGSVYIYGQSASFNRYSQEAIVQASDREFGCNFARPGAAALSADGSRMIVGANSKDEGATANTGAVYVFVRVGNNWVQEAKIVAPVGAANLNFGTFVDIDYTGTRIIAGCIGETVSGAATAGTAYIFTRSGSTWTFEQKLQASDPLAGAQFGIAVALSSSADYAVIGAQTYGTSAPASAGAAYIFVRSGTTWTQQAQLLASDRAANDNFGNWVAIDSTGTRALVAALQASPGSVSQAGAAYVFVRSGTTWTQEAKLTANDKAASDAFGQSLDIDGSGTYVAVGAFGRDSGGLSNSGGFYIFKRTGTTWAQTFVGAVSSANAANDGLGRVVSIDSDGVTLAVGALSADIENVGVATGAGYVYTRGGGEDWTLDSVYMGSVRANGDFFGACSAISADGTRVAFGAISSDIGVSESGAVFVFTSTGVYVPYKQEARILPDDLAIGDTYGNSVASTSDGTKIVVASYQSNPSGINDAGCVYTFKKQNGVWIQEQKIVPSDAAPSDFIGYKVDMARDGSRMVITGTLANPSGLADAGAAWIYVYTGGVWTFEQKLVPSDVAGSDQFGFTASMSQDGVRVAISSRNKIVAPSTDQSGAVYVFVRSGTTWTQEQKIVDPVPTNINLFGYMLDMDGSGTRLAIGSLQGDSTTVNDSGTVHVFIRTGSIWALEQKLQASDPIANSYFGCPVAISQDGTRLIAGASGTINNGAAYIFLRTGTTWTQEAKIVAPDGMLGDRFGYAVELNSDASVALITAAYADTSVVDAGAVYMFVRTGTTWVFLTKFIKTDGAKLNDVFGGALAMSADGKIQFIGSHLSDTNGMTDSGALYVFS